MVHRRASARLAALALSALPLVLFTRSALAQAPPAKPGEKKVDTEFDPDAKPKEPPPLPPVQEGQWGVGGKEEEGRFAPQNNKKKEDEERAKQKAEEEKKKPVDLGPERAVWIDTVVGFGSIRDVTHDSVGSDAGRTSTTGASLLFGFRWRVAEIWSLFARFPFTRASVNGPGGVYNTFAAGNLELGVSPSFAINRRLRIPAQISLFLPTGQGDFLPDRTMADQNIRIAQAQLNMASSAARGWEEMPLFATRRVGLRAGGGIAWDSDAIHVKAGTGIDMMFKVSGGAPEDDPSYASFKVATVTYAWVTHASFHYGFLDGMLEPGLRAWLAVAKLPVSTNVTDYSGPQFVLEPQVNGRFPVNADKTMAIKAGLGFILPVAGPLGGSQASIKGFRINAAFEF